VHKIGLDLRAGELTGNEGVIGKGRAEKGDVLGVTFFRMIIR